MDEQFGLLLSLDGKSSDYVLGVEMGRLWEQLKQPEPFEQTIHAEQVEIVMRMREVVDREIRVEDSTDEAWVHLLVGELVEEAA